MNTSSFDFFTPTKLIFGPGKLNDLKEIAPNYGQKCLIVSRPSAFLEVNIFTEQFFSITKSKSFNSPLTLIIIACLAKDLLIFSAKSKPVIFFGKSNFFPSGRVIIGI